jgi:hypothetical protein
VFGGGGVQCDERRSVSGRGGVEFDLHGICLILHPANETGLRPKFSGQDSMGWIVFTNRKRSAAYLNGA